MKAVPTYSEVPTLTIRQLCNLAEKVRNARGKRKQQLTDRMRAACWYLKESGALGQLLWCAREVEPESPVGERAEVIPFPGPQLVG